MSGIAEFYDTYTDDAIKRIVARIDLDKVSEHRLHLTYVDYRDELDPKQVETVLRDGWDEGVDEWLSENRRNNAYDLADELFKEACEDEEYEELEHEWGPSDERDELVFDIEERDTSDPYRQLLRNTGHMLFRVHPCEDGMAWLDAETLDGPASGVCEAVGLPAEYIDVVAQIQPEIAGYAAEGGGHFLAAIVFRASPLDLYGLSEDQLVEVAEPFVWLTNPWVGNGYGEVAKGLTFTLRVGDIQTDKAAWGYGADDVFGGLCLDDSKITVKETA